MRAFAIALVCVGCAPLDQHDVSFVVAAIGQPNGTFPSAAERLGIMAINRARSDPATVKGPSSTIYPARPPVAWSYNFSRSSRFHASNEASHSRLKSWLSREKGNVSCMSARHLGQFSSEPPRLHSSHMKFPQRAHVRLAGA